MSLQRRLLLFLLISAPLVWILALVISIEGVEHEVNELYDTQMIRLARQVHALLGPGHHALPSAALLPLPVQGSEGSAEADVRDLAIAVWDADGKLTLTDNAGVRLPYRAQANGFMNERLGEQTWRVYYLRSASGEWLVAAGQNVHERQELVFNLTSSHLLPWILVLPALLVVMALAVRRALRPVRQFAADLQMRDGDDLRPIPPDSAPAELKPLVGAMNSMFERLEAVLQRERRFTADAAHELRTPLAVLRAQWDVHCRAQSESERRSTQDKLNAGFDRVDRLVTQMLALSRLEATAQVGASEALDWRPLVEQVMSDCLDLSERRRIELACEWPGSDQAAMPMHGNVHLMTVLLRNLMDNAARYARSGTQVTLRFFPDSLEVENETLSLNSEQLARLGERFYRPDGQQEVGSGLGVSIMQRIALLHRLRLDYTVRPDGQGVKAVLQRV